MIKIEVDEAYAYDMFAIATIKLSKNDNSLNRANYASLACDIYSGIGEKHHLIISSSEYEELYRINRNIFEYIDKMKTNPSIEDGVWVDKQNYARFLAKKALQEKFFPSQKLSEQKIGYEK